MKNQETKKCACGGDCSCHDKKKITPQTKISEVLEINPDAAELLFEIGLGCIGCSMSMYESLEDGCRGHGMSDEDINDIVNELNSGLE